MPLFFKAIGEEFSNRFSRKDTASVNRYEGFQANGAVVLRDRRGTVRAEIPDITEKGATFSGNDPLAIYRPSGAKQIDAAKAMANFTGWPFAAVNAIAREISNIQFRLYRAKGDDQQEITDHPLLTLHDGVNEYMTGPGLKYTMAAH